MMINWNRRSGETSFSMTSFIASSKWYIDLAEKRKKIVLIRIQYFKIAYQQYVNICRLLSSDNKQDKANGKNFYMMVISFLFFETLEKCIFKIV